MDKDNKNVLYVEKEGNLKHFAENNVQQKKALKVTIKNIVQ